MSFRATRGVHNKDDAVPMGLKEPLIDFTGEVVADSGTYLERQDWRDRLGCPLGCHRTDRKDFVRRSNDGGERGQYFGMNARIFNLGHLVSPVGYVVRKSKHYFAGSVNSTRRGLSGPRGMNWNSINPAWPIGSLLKRS